MGAANQQRYQDYLKQVMATLPEGLSDAEIEARLKKALEEARDNDIAYVLEQAEAGIDAGIEETGMAVAQAREEGANEELQAARDALNAPQA